MADPTPPPLPDPSTKTWAETFAPFKPWALKLAEWAVFVAIGVLLQRYGISPSVPVPPPADPAAATAPVAGEAVAGDVADMKAKMGVGRRLAFAAARNKAADELAKDKGITHRQAKALLDKVDDPTLQTALEAAGVDLSGVPAGGPLANILNWIQTHQELIAQIVQILLLLVAVV